MFTNFFKMFSVAVLALTASATALAGAPTAAEAVKVRTKSKSKTYQATSARPTHHQHQNHKAVGVSPAYLLPSDTAQADYEASGFQRYAYIGSPVNGQVPGGRFYTKQY